MPNRSELIAGGKMAVDVWADKVCRYRADVAQAEDELGRAVEKARHARQALSRSEAQLENAQRLLREAERLDC